MDRLAHRSAFGPRRTWPLLQWIAVGIEAAVARIVLEQERHSSANYRGECAERKIGTAPSEHLDQERCQRRHHQGANPDSAHGEAGGKAAPPHKPALHRADGRNIGAADAKSDAEAVGCVNLDQAARGACRGKPEADQEHAC